MYSPKSSTTGERPNMDTDGHSSTNSLYNTAPRTYRTYPIRWAVVFVLALLNGSNAFIWISFAPIADHFVAYYQTSESVLNWMQLIFPITTVVFGMPAALLVDWHGVRFVVILSACVNLLCGILRALTSIDPFWPSSDTRLGLVVLAQVVASFAQPLCMFTPTKLALEWFPDSQRTTANTIGSMGNTLGVLLGSGLAPVFVNSPADIPKFNYISLGLVCLGLVITLIVVRRGKPLTPPSAAAFVFDRLHRRGENTLTRLNLFIRNTIRPFKIRAFWILIFSFGGALAYFTALSTLFEQILCAKGYSNQYAGLCGSVMVIAGMVASVFSALFVDRTGLITETIKIGYVVAVLGAVGMSVVLYFPNQTASILFFVIWFGGFGFSQYSLTLELAAEATFPVPEAITSGLLIISSQIMSIIFVSFMQAVAVRVEPNAIFTPVCGPAATPKDYSLPNLILCSFLVIVSIVQLFTLRVSYLRRQASIEASLQVNLNSDTIVTVSSSYEQSDEHA